MGHHAAPIPDNEEDRLCALESYAVLDSEPERAFDDLAQLAADVCETPYAVITFVDRNRQWFKASIGFNGRESSRELSFCAHTILADGVLVIPDATTDPRFRESPVVLGEPRLRFYAGAPLITPEGHRIGTICTFDTLPRELAPRQVSALEKLASLVMNQLALRAERMRAAELNVALERKESDLITVGAVKGAILANAGFAIIAVDSRGKIEIFNPAAERLLGYTQAEVLGSSPMLFHDKELVKQRAAEFSKVLGTPIEPGFEVFVCKTRRGLPNEHEWTYIHKSGRRIPVLLSVTALRQTNGKIFGFIGLAADISTQNRLRAQIEAREGQLKAFIEHAPAAVAMFDTSLRYLAYSKRWLSDYHLGDRNLIGLSHYEVFPEIGDDWREKHARCLQGEIISCDADLFERADGSKQWLKWELRPWYTSQGEVAGMSMLTEDITGRIQLMNELRIASETTIAATAAKSQFLANVSHEIRTPLTAIIGFAEAAQDPHLSVEERTNALTTIRNSGEHLLGIINDILDLSKINAGALRLESLPTSPVNLVEEVRHMLLPPVAEKSLSLIVNYRWPLPRLINTDPLRLKQVLMNLVANAIKFTPHGWIEITVTCDPIAHRLRFIVADSGIGVSEEQLKHLFEPFAQADRSTTRRFGGTGLGLSISAQLVNGLGGEISAESNEGRGSRFSFSIDTGSLAEAEWLHAVPAKSLGLAPAPSIDPRLLKGRVLVADDAADNRRLLEVALRKTNLELTLVENGQLALDAVQATHYDIILLDMQMPVLDGYATVRELRRRGNRLPIIAFSASTTKNHILRCTEAGCTTHLAKPFSQAELFDLLSRHLV